MDNETMAIFYGFTEEEAEALKEAARVWAERVKTAFEEAAEALLRILSALGPSEFESLEKLQKELEEIGKEPRARRRKLGAGPGAGHRTAIPGGDSPVRAGTVLQADI